MKILSGKWKNTPFNFKKKINIKPTSTLIKKILFNWLGNYIWNKNCLDLFCGLGTLGFEAASRGCNTTMVEKNKIIFNQLSFFKKKIKAKNILLYNMDSFLYIKKFKFLKYDLIFLDPPYKKFKDLFFFIKKCLFLLKKNSLIFIESNLNIFLIINYFKNIFKIKKNNFLGKKNFFLLEVI